MSTGGGICMYSCQELKGLHAPPEAVKSIAAAVLALLGVIGTIDVRSERDPRLWKFFRIKLTQTSGHDSLVHRMNTLDAKTVTEAQVALAKRMVAGLTLAIVRNNSKAAAEFYLWVCNAIKQAES